MVSCSRPNTVPSRFHLFDLFLWKAKSRISHCRIRFAWQTNVYQTKVVVKDLWVSQTACPPIFINASLERNIRIVYLDPEHLKLAWRHWWIPRPLPV